MDIIKEIQDHPYVKRLFKEEDIKRLIAYIESEEIKNFLITGLRDLAPKRT